MIDYYEGPTQLFELVRDVPAQWDVEERGVGEEGDDSETSVIFWLPVVSEGEVSISALKNIMHEGGVLERVVQEFEQAEPPIEVHDAPIIHVYGGQNDNPSRIEVGVETSWPLPDSVSDTLHEASIHVMAAVARESSFRATLAEIQGLGATA